jgi:hypothetical protein
MIIGIAAKARSGKDTFLDFLIERHRELGNDYHKKFVKHPFAAPLKDFCDEMLGFTQEHREGSLKETVGLFPIDFGNLRDLIIKHFGKHPTKPVDRKSSTKIHQAIIEVFWDNLFCKVNSSQNYLHVSPREVYQKVGTEVMRENHLDSFWIDYLQQYDLSTTIVGVPDVRFENEVKIIRKLGGQITHLERPNVVSVANHSSENGVSIIEDDIIIVNEGSLEDFREKAVFFYNNEIEVLCGKEEKEEEVRRERSGDIYW